MLTVENLSKEYSSTTRTIGALDHVDFNVEEGEFVSIVGPSGAGKTTLLKCMAGLLSPTSGTVQIKGREVHEPPAEMAVVFQDYSRSLFPWFTNLKNVE